MTSNAAFFRVSMQMRPGMPATGPLGPFKLVSAGSLGPLVRELVIKANLFSQVYLQSVGVTHASAPGAPPPPPTTDPAKRQRIEYVSHWRARLRQIQRLKQWAVADSADVRAQMDQETRDWDVCVESGLSAITDAPAGIIGLADLALYRSLYSRVYNYPQRHRPDSAR